MTQKATIYLLALAALTSLLGGCALFQRPTLVIEREVPVQVCTPTTSPYAAYGDEIRFQALTPADQLPPPAPTPSEKEGN